MVSLWRSGEERRVGRRVIFLGLRGGVGGVLSPGPGRGMEPAPRIVAYLILGLGGGSGADGLSSRYVISKVT